MIDIVFESHSTTLDNEAHLSSGHNDIQLSTLGIAQAKELGERYKNDHFDAIYCSDLERSYKTAEIAFGTKFPILKDKRLRECDYGDFTQQSSEIVDPLKAKHISIPFPHGESYEQTSTRIKSFLSDIMRKQDIQRILIIGHRATQYGLEHWINKKSLIDSVTENWEWQPGWHYRIVNLGL